MSGLKNSPFGKRLRATQQDPEEEGPRRSRPRTNPVFGVAPASTPSLDSSRPSTSESCGPESPTELHRPNKDYGDRFVPSRDAGDLRTSYNLMEESGPSTPSRNRVIPTESDAAKGKPFYPLLTLLSLRTTCSYPDRRVGSAFFCCPIPSIRLYSSAPSFSSFHRRWIQSLFVPVYMRSVYSLLTYHIRQNKQMRYSHPYSIQRSHLPLLAALSLQFAQVPPRPMPPPPLPPQADGVYFPITLLLDPTLPRRPDVWICRPTKLTL